MAQLTNRLPQNTPGDFFVDSTCIDCDACRQIAPASFRDHGGQSSVYRQPQNPGQLHRALMALVACPTASIGTVSRRNARSGVTAFPVHVVDDVYFCGFTSEASFGAWSYLIVRPPEQGGNVLVDSPRYNNPLVKRIEEMGGVNLMLLSHRDDIADHAKFAAHFHCPRVMHEADGAAAHSIERVISGTAHLLIDNDLRLIPTPGHTATRYFSTAIKFCSPEIILHGRPNAKPSPHSATSAGFPGQNKRAPWKSCWPINSSGSCQATAASAMARQKKCTPIWKVA
jgi:ferredoxin